MRVGKQLVLAIAALALLGGVGCKKRKPNLPPQTQPPTVTQPEPETVPIQPPVENTPPATAPPIAEPEPQPVPPTPKPKHHAKRKKTTVPAAPETKPSAAKPSSAPKVTPETKPNENVQISAEIPQNVANQRRQQTEGLLSVAEANLKKINRPLSDGEESMQRQVQNFINQSRLAIQDGDFERAYNLATKAQQLSQELAK